MKNTLVVVADLGCLKAFKLENGTAQTPRLELIEQFDNPEAHNRLVERVTDQSGRFHRGAAKPTNGNVMSDGERHNIELEQRKRFVRELARRLNSIARGKEIECCFLAASREINHQLVDELEPQVRAKIEKNLSADLTKLERAEILGRF
jgi:protein required for attachment to host cells